MAPSCGGNYWVYGDAGLGKTLTCRYFGREVEARGLGKTYYLPIKERQSLRKALFNFALSEMLPGRTGLKQLLTQLITRDNPARVFFIIDDYQNIQPWSKPYFDGFLFGLYEHLTELLPFNELNIPQRFSIIIISQINPRNIPNYLSESVQSRLQLRTLSFGPYSAFELVEIFQQRLNYVFKRDDVYEKAAITRLAAKMVRIGGDLRLAFRILRDAIMEAKTFLSEAHIERAWKKEKDRFWKSQLLELKPHEALILGVTADLALTYQPPSLSQDDADQIKPTEKPIPITAIFYGYKQLCENLDIDPLSNRMAYYMIDSLTDMGYLIRVQQSPIINKRLVHVQLGEKPENILSAFKNIDWKQVLTE